MEFEVKIRLLYSERTVKYEFALQPLHVERIDILESKLKHQHEELENLRRKVDGGDASVSLYVESLAEQDTTEWRMSKLQWKNVASANFVLSEDKKAITILRPGLYAAAVVVNHVSCTNGGIGYIITLEKDGVAIQSAVTGGSASRCKRRGLVEVTLQALQDNVLSIVCIFQAEKGEEISVACSDTSPISTVPSYLTLAQIGV